VINTANTWTSISVTIPGDTSGTWVGSTNAAAALLSFGFGVGSTYSGTAGSWSATNYVSAAGAVSVVGTLNATFYITGVQLEPGSVATPFERRPINEVLAQCQRYYQTAQTVVFGSSGAQWISFLTTMRTSPTTSLTNITYGNSNGGVASNPNPNGFNPAYNVTNTGAYMISTYMANAEI